MSTATIRAALKSLQESGHITKARAGRQGAIGYCLPQTCDTSAESESAAKSAAPMTQERSKFCRAYCWQAQQKTPRKRSKNCPHTS
jgi:hypothetical protein